MPFRSFFKYFIPKDKKVFFSLFEEAANNVVVMATLLVETVNTDIPATREDLIRQIYRLESKGDDVTRKIYLELGKGFTPSFSRSDIHSLASAIDNVADNIQGAANRMSLYRIDDFNENIKQLSGLILQATIDMEKAINELKNIKNVRNIADLCIRINNIENQADHVFERAVADLFLYETDAIRLIKYKEVLSSLETATDMCEDAANVIESILIKNV